MGNFDFLKNKPDYNLFAPTAIEAEGVYSTSPSLSALLCRKALELSVKWVYRKENIAFPYNDNLQSLLHASDFQYLMDHSTWYRLQLIVKAGNLAAHEERKIPASTAVESLHSLFEFIQWLDYCYGATYEERYFSESKIPQDVKTVNEKRIRQQGELLKEKDAENQKLLEELAAIKAELASVKEQHKAERHFNPEKISEFKTRKIYIDVDLQLEGWVLDGPSSNVVQEYQVENMAGVPGQAGFADYVLMGADGLPLAVVEAKKTSQDPNMGRQQAVLYANAIENMCGRRPFMFTTNGFETYFWDDRSGTPRKVSGIFGQDDLSRLMIRRSESQGPLTAIPISDAITNRAYQKEAIRSVCANLAAGHRKNLLVMATGTGKTRVAASLTDVLSRGNRITHVLFLADRTALVSQAKDAFKEYLPRMSLCNLCNNKDDRNARIVFSTYPTILNAIDESKNVSGSRLFTPAHFDLIIIDESHRSIFKKYKTIFDYFDAILVGLTATPRTDVDRNTYEFFDTVDGVPTYAYDYDQAIEQNYLVPYYNYEVRTKFLEEGITYDELSDADKARYEEDFAEDDGRLPDFIPSKKLNNFVFNTTTVDMVLEDLMERGIKVHGGDRLGKTIIFAENKRHAEFIVQRFNALYPSYNGKFARRIVCGDPYVETLIDDFKNPEKNPVIAVSVDMMDTGIDVPECVNLVFFKKVRSKTKFWQMIGRGTRLCPNLSCVDGRSGEYVGKKYFLIFDYCGNFEYFRQVHHSMGDKLPKTLSENLFDKRVELMKILQKSDYRAESYQNWRAELADLCQKQVKALNTDLVSVRMHLKSVERFKKDGAFLVISEGDSGELAREVAPLVSDPEKSEPAKRFDNFIYGMMVAQVEKLPTYDNAKKQLLKTVVLLKEKVSIKAIREEMSLLDEIESPDFLDTVGLLELDEIRSSLRGLIQFISGKGNKERIITTVLNDPITYSSEGHGVEAETFESYQEKVESYFTKHIDDVPAVQKLVHNEPLTQADYQALEHIFKVELGTPEEYKQFFADEPLGLVVRRIAKLDAKAAEAAFSSFINEEHLNARQIAFVKMVIKYVEVNGYIDSPARLMTAPFDQYNCGEIFNFSQMADLAHVLNTIRDNAVKVR